MEVSLPAGTVRGQERDGVRYFPGIPYAAPPVGELRFALPAPVEPWTGVRGGEESPSLQPDVVRPDKIVGSEDCLYVNVWAPTTPGPHRVFVWVHGGGGTIGSPHDYVGTAFARDDVVVVTIGYRLGALGLLHAPEAFGGTNFSLHDQISALRWVQHNIAAFGADPARVTLAGESNGGRTVGTLLAAPEARGLFQQAVVQSGTGVGTLVHTPAEGARNTAGFLAQLGLGPGDAARLRALPASEILAAQAKHSAQTGSRVPYRVVADEPPLDVVARGHAAGVRLLIGTTHDEADLFTLLGDQGVLTLTPPEFDAVLARYRERFPDESEEELRGRARTAADWWLPAIRFAEAQHGAGGEVWMYRLAWRSGANGLRACHALDLPLVFDDVTNRYFRLFLGRDPERAGKVATTMHDAWVRFVHGESPWPRYEPSRRTTMLFDTESRTADDPDAAERNLWRA